MCPLLVTNSFLKAKKMHTASRKGILCKALEITKAINCRGSWPLIDQRSKFNIFTLRFLLIPELRMKKHPSDLYATHKASAIWWPLLLSFFLLWYFTISLSLLFDILT